MDQRRWLERVVRTFAAKVRGSSSSKVLVNERYQFLACPQVTSSPGAQQSTDVDRRIQAPSISLQFGPIIGRAD